MALRFSGRFIVTQATRSTISTRTVLPPGSEAAGALEVMARNPSFCGQAGSRPSRALGPRAREFHSRHPEVRAKRASKGAGPRLFSSILRGPLRDHLRMTNGGQAYLFSRRVFRPSYAKPLPRTNVRTPIFVRRHRRWTRLPSRSCSASQERRKEIKGSGTPKDAGPQ